MNRIIRRNQIYFADLDPIIGSEQGGNRPVLIVQNDIGNYHSPTTIIAPITSKPKPRLPTHQPIRWMPGLEHDSVVLTEQVRTLDKTRLIRYVGSLDNVAMWLVDAALAISLGIARQNEDKELRTLCHKCKMDYEDAGYTLRLVSNLNDPKDTCDICNYRHGFTYELREGDIYASN